MEKTLLIAGAGANQIGIYQKAREMGITTVATDGNAQAIGFKQADHAEAVNITDPDALLQVARQYHVDGIYPAAELSVEAVAGAARKADLPGISIESAERVRNKATMRRALDAANIPNPKYAEITSLAEAQTAIGDIGFPCVIKPADANSSKGVQQLTSADDLEAAVQLALENSFRSGSALIEEFLDGEEFCIDGLVHEGQYIPGGITGKELSPLPHRFDKGIYMPPNRSDEDCRILEECTANALRAIEFTSGTVHAEIILTAEGPRIVEIAGRPGGGRIPTDLIPVAYGMDFMADSIRIALGEAPQSSRQHSRGVALYWFEAEPGTVTEIVDREKALAIPGVREIVFQASPGDVLDPIIDCVSRDAIGYVFTEGRDQHGAVDIANKARSICKVITR
jgi:biotin carboxylase